MVKQGNDSPGKTANRRAKKRLSFGVQPTAPVKPFLIFAALSVVLVVFFIVYAGQIFKRKEPVPQAHVRILLAAQDGGNAYSVNITVDGEQPVVLNGDAALPSGEVESSLRVLAASRPNIAWKVYIRYSGGATADDAKAVAGFCRKAFPGAEIMYEGNASHNRQP